MLECGSAGGSRCFSYLHGTLLPGEQLVVGGMGFSLCCLLLASCVSSVGSAFCLGLVLLFVLCVYFKLCLGCFGGVECVV